MVGILRVQMAVVSCICAFPQSCADAWKPWKSRSWKVWQHVHHGDLERQWRRLEGHWRKRRQVHYNGGSAHISYETGGSTRFPISTRALQAEEQLGRSTMASWPAKRVGPASSPQTGPKQNIRSEEIHRLKREIERLEDDKAEMRKDKRRLEGRLEAERVTRERLTQALADERVKSSKLAAEMLGEQKAKLACTRSRAAEKLVQNNRRKIEEQMRQLHLRELDDEKGRSERLAVELAAKQALLATHNASSKKHDDILANAKLTQENARLQDENARLSSALFVEKVGRATEREFLILEVERKTKEACAKEQRERATRCSLQGKGRKDKRRQILNMSQTCRLEGARKRRDSGRTSKRNRTAKTRHRIFQVGLDATPTTLVLHLLSLVVFSGLAIVAVHVYQLGLTNIEPPRMHVPELEELPGEIQQNTEQILAEIRKDEENHDIMLAEDVNEKAEDDVSAPTLTYETINQDPETTHEERGPDQSPLSNAHISECLDDISEVSSFALSEEFEMVEASEDLLS